MSHHNTESPASTHSGQGMGPYILLSALLPGLIAAFTLYIYRSQGHLVFRAHGFPIWVLGIFSAILIPLFIFEWSREKLTADFQLDMLDNDQLKQVNYFRIYLVTFLQTIWSIFVVLMLVWLFSEIAGLFLSILKAGTSNRKVLTDLYAYLLSLLPLVTLAAFVFLLLQLFRHRTTALAVGLFIYILARSLVYLNNPIGKFNPAAYMDWHLEWLSSKVALGTLWQESAYLMILLVVFFTLGYYMFARKR